MLSEKAYLKAMEKFKLTPYNEAQKEKGVADLKRILKLNNHRVKVFSNFHLMNCDIHSKKLTIHLVDNMNIPPYEPYVFTLSPFGCLSIGLDVLHFCKNPYFQDKFFYVDGFSCRREKLVSTISRELYNDERKLIIY